MKEKEIFKVAKKRDFKAKFIMDRLIETSAWFGFSCLFSHKCVDKHTQIIQFAVFFAIMTIFQLLKNSRSTSKSL
jgi:hypothetical protein